MNNNNNNNKQSMATIQLRTTLEGKQELLIQDNNENKSITVTNEDDIRFIIQQLDKVCISSIQKESGTSRCLSCTSTLATRPQGTQRKVFKIISGQDLDEGVTMVFLKQSKDSYSDEEWEKYRFNFDSNVLKDFLFTPDVFLINAKNYASPPEFNVSSLSVDQSDGSLVFKSLVNQGLMIKVSNTNDVNNIKDAIKKILAPVSSNRGRCFEVDVPIHPSTSNDKNRIYVGQSMDEKDSLWIEFRFVSTDPFDSNYNECDEVVFHVIRSSLRNFQ